MSADVMDLPEELGLARPEPERLKRIVANALQIDADAIATVEAMVAAKVDYAIGTPMTHALLRCRGTAILDDGVTRAWSAFVKVLQSPWAWEHIDRIPAEFRADFADNVPWRLELDAYRPEVIAALPDGFRPPRLYDVVEIDDRHVAVWMEDVEPSPEPWDSATFARAAELLGRLAARRPIGTAALLAPSPAAATPGFTLRYYVGGRVKMGTLPGLDDDALWAHPTVAAALKRTGDTTIRADLVAAGRRLDSWLDRLDALPQTYCHGDASPQNLLVPASDPSGFVVIDWSFNSPLAVGFDLGQLLIGLAHAGELCADALPGVLTGILPAYCHGLTDEGFAASPEDVRTGFLLGLVVRSMFTALPLEALGAPPSPAQTDYWVERIRLTRFMLGLAAEFGD